jgi:hypothetical protein
VKDEDEREAMWEQQHELGAQKMYSLCSELGGLFLKVGVLGFARPILIFLSSSLIFKCPHSHPPKKGACDRSCNPIVLVTVIALVVLCIIML